MYCEVNTLPRNVMRKYNSALSAVNNCFHRKGMRSFEVKIKCIIVGDRSSEENVDVKEPPHKLLSRGGLLLFLFL